MKHPIAFFTLAASFAWSGHALALTKAEYDAQKDRIEADFKSSRERCGSMQANAKDVCEAQAKGDQKIARAQLEAQYKPSARNDQKVKEAQADARYDVAKEQCDDMEGNRKDVCVKEAKAAQTAAKADARVTRASSAERPAVPGAAGTAGSGMTDNRSTQAGTPANSRQAATADARKDAAEDKNKAQYEVAKERCDAMSGNAKDSCISAAKQRYGQ